MKVEQHLVDGVIEQMKVDIAADDWTSIEELLKRVDYDVLIGFLSDLGMPDADDTYDEYGVNTKNSFNTPPADEPHPSGVTAEWNGEDWVFRGELIQHHWGMSSTCFSPSELGYTYNDAARLAPYKAIDALVLWLAAD